MRKGLFFAALAASITAGAGAAVVDLRVPHQISLTSNAAPICRPINFMVYFGRDEAKLTEPAERMLDIVGGNMRGCAIRSVAIEASANETASAAGRSLAARRGAAILGALNARGLAAQSVIVAQTGAVGEPASAAPPHLTVSIDAVRGALTAGIRPRIFDDDA